MFLFACCIAIFDHIAFIANVEISTLLATRGAYKVSVSIDAMVYCVLFCLHSLVFVLLSLSVETKIHEYITPQLKPLRDFFSRWEIRSYGWWIALISTHVPLKYEDHQHCRSSYS